MNIYLREMNINKKSLIIWILSIMFFVILEIQEYEAYSSTATNMAEFAKMLDSMPKFIQTMWGISTFDLTTPIGFYAVIFSFLILTTCIHAGMFGANIISKEERDRTSEFLMTKPISRSKVLTCKMLASITNILILNLSVVICTSIVLKSMTTETILKQMILASIGMFMLQLLFLVIGFGVSCISKNYKNASYITISILLGTYFFSMIIDISEKFEKLSILTPFKYFLSEDFFIHYKLNTGYLILTLTIIIVILIISYNGYSKKDLNV